MGRERWSRRAVGIVASCVCAAALAAQHDATPPRPPVPAAAAKSDAEQKRGAADSPTHAPQPVLHPLLAWKHVKDGNAAATAALAADKPVPEPAERPAGAGRYLCAVLVCADVDADIAPLLGLRRSDVLLLSVPGPFATPETTALLERAVADERLSLVLVFTHENCRALTPRTPADALTTRADAVAAEAARRQQPLTKALACLQRDQLLAASELLRAKVAKDELRILPATIDPKTATLSWHHARIDAMPLAPVK